MKRAITVQKIEESTFAAVKQLALDKGVSISSLMEEIMQGYLTGNSKVQNEDTAKNEAIKAAKHNEELYLDACKKIEQLEAEQEKQIEEAEFTIASLQEDNSRLKEANYEVKCQLAATQEALNEATAANDIQAEKQKQGVFVELPPLELRLVEQIAEKEASRTGMQITPSVLLAAMFTNYCFKGETWFFPFPKKSEIRAIQEQLNKEESNE